MNPSRFSTLRRIALALALLVFSLKVQAAPPNIVLILCDDVGYGELGFQGNSEIPTPHIDSIARNGIRFTQGYVSGPYCSPTRAGLLTGRYQTRFGHEWNGAGAGFGLPLSEKTLADRLKAVGYATAAVGKWHLGDQLHNRPTERGFDEFYGTLANTSFFHPRAFVDSRQSQSVQEITDPRYYLTDGIAGRAVDWIERHKNQPFFLYLPFNAQHAPLQASKKYLDRFTNITDEKRRLFAGMLSAMDDAVGQVLAKLKQIGQWENTLIVFLSDNGGPTQATTSKNGALRGFKSTTLEGGVRVPFCLQWTAKLPAGTVYEHPVIQLDLLPTCLAAAGVEAELSWELDGVNLLPYLTGENKGLPHETLYWRFGAQWAIRQGDWKLVASRLDGETPRLFNLAKDIGEARDLSAQHTEKARALREAWNEWNAEQKDPLWEPAQRRRARQTNPAR